MRKIKFRAWYKDKMYEVFAVIGDMVRISLMRFPFSQEVVPDSIMQYTGLLDKNGKEIFEFDILHSKTWGKDSRPLNPYHIVIWKEIKWVASGYNGEMMVNPDLTIKDDFEIIGNIYENPELINGKA